MFDASIGDSFRECPPVLFITFNRIDTTRKVFQAIRQAKPSRLYLASDGPRPSHPEDAEKIRQVRDHLVASVDWQCEIHILFQETNLGCKDAPIAGINWLFENEEAGIILEDDCLPHPDFFPFCAEVLNRYKDCEEIYAICGTNIKARWKEEYSGFFSLMGGNWGWASWRRAWGHYRSDITDDLNDANWSVIAKNLENARIYRCIRKMIESNAASMNGDAWDYQWFFRRLIDNGLSLIPSRNLISNIGFGEDSTHTSDPTSSMSKLPVDALPVTFSFPDIIKPDRTFDHFYLESLQPSFISKVFSKLKAILS